MVFSIHESSLLPGGERFHEDPVLVSYSYLIIRSIEQYDLNFFNNFFLA